MCGFKSKAYWIVAAGVIFGLYTRIEYLGENLPGSQLTLDFSHSYATAWLLNSGQIPYGIDLVPLLAQWGMNCQYPSYQATNPPFLAMLMVPLANLTPATAWATMLMLIIASSILSLTMLLSALGVPLRSPTGFLTLLMFAASSSLCSNLVWTQVQCLMLMLVTAGWVALRTGRQHLAGILWGLSFAAKLYTWPLLLLLFVLRKNRALLWAGGTIFICVAAPEVLFGPGQWQAFARSGIPQISSMGQDLWSNYSLSRLVLAIFGPAFASLSIWTPFTLACVTTFILTTLITTVTGARFGNRPTGALNLRNLDLLTAATALLAFTSSPVTWLHYMVVLLFSMTILWHYSNRSTGTACLLLFSYLLLQLPGSSSKYGFLSASTYTLVFPMMIWIAIIIVLLMLVTELWRKNSAAG